MSEHDDDVFDVKVEPGNCAFTPRGYDWTVYHRASRFTAEGKAWTSAQARRKLKRAKRHLAQTRALAEEFGGNR